MPYVIKRTEDGMYVSRPGSARSYTADRQQAWEFNTAREAQAEACQEGESVWYSPGESPAGQEGGRHGQAEESTGRAEP